MTRRYTLTCVSEGGRCDPRRLPMHAPTVLRLEKDTPQGQLIDGPEVGEGVSLESADVRAILKQVQ